MTNIITHKRIHDSLSRQACLCGTRGGTITAYSWRKVNCKRCQEIRKVELTGKQIMELARKRIEGKDQ